MLAVCALAYAGADLQPGDCEVGPLGGLGGGDQCLLDIKLGVACISSELTAPGAWCPFSIAATPVHATYVFFLLSSLTGRYHGCQTRRWRGACATGLLRPRCCRRMRRRPHLQRRPPQPSAWCPAQQQARQLRPGTAAPAAQPLRR